MPTAALEAAFKATIYRVEASEARFDLRIGVVDRAFNDWLLAQGVSCWGILTACNPGALCLSDEANRLRQAQLQAQLRRCGWHFLAACNLDSEGIWPPEPGFFVLQIDPVPLCVLAGRFSQIAAVWGETGSPPRLLWVEAGTGERL